ncbi:hypothetical protein GALMADRAFT_253601 [Galerina marginata CBS 339.88]|uniref:Uncharacterized protein n=1 Tax=Galerina marginata (strain CBS 339.88) TaxID=685588 RepID=A0A067SLQ3_GALM3|nr:hypothetical protein GALMADRAFT_253601 [Galerina marginata CBS 339.88]
MEREPYLAQLAPSERVAISSKSAMERLYYLYPKSEGPAMRGNANPLAKLPHLP